MHSLKWISKTASGQLVTGQVAVYGFRCTNGGTAIFYDNTAGSGTELSRCSAPANVCDRDPLDGNGGHAPAAIGVYVTISGATEAAILVDAGTVAA